LKIDNLIDIIKLVHYYLAMKVKDKFEYHTQVLKDFGKMMVNAMIFIL